MSADRYTYRITWSPEDGEYVGLCVELPSLPRLAATPTEALSGIRQVAAEAVADMQSNGEPIPDGSQLATVQGREAANALAPGVPTQSRPKQRLPLVAFLQGLGLGEIEIEREEAAHPDRRSTST